MNIPHKSYGGNDGVIEGHELVVLRTNLAPEKIPLDKKRRDGGQFAVEVGRVGKPLVLAPGKSGTVTLNLKPGKYVLICNLFGHYEAGEHAAFKVVG